MSGHRCCPRRRPLTDVIIEVNAALCGWAYYFRVAIAGRRFSFLRYFTWRRFVAWQREHHRWNWSKVKRCLRRAAGSWTTIATEDAVLFDPTKVRMERYRYRGSVKTPIIGRPRPLPPSDAPTKRYTLDCEEPLAAARSARQNKRIKAMRYTRMMGPRIVFHSPCWFVGSVCSPVEVRRTWWSPRSGSESAICTAASEGAFDGPYG